MHYHNSLLALVSLSLASIVPSLAEPTQRSPPTAGPASGAVLDKRAWEKEKRVYRGEAKIASGSELWTSNLVTNPGLGIVYPDAPAGQPNQIVAQPFVETLFEDTETLLRRVRALHEQVPEAARAPGRGKAVLRVARIEQDSDIWEADLGDMMYRDMWRQNVNSVKRTLDDLGLDWRVFLKDVDRRPRDPVGVVATVAGRDLEVDGEYVMVGGRWKAGVGGDAHETGHRTKALLPADDSEERVPWL